MACKRPTLDISLVSATLAHRERSPTFMVVGELTNASNVSIPREAIPLLASDGATGRYRCFVWDRLWPGEEEAVRGMPSLWPGQAITLRYQFDERDVIDPCARWEFVPEGTTPIDPIRYRGHREAARIIRHEVMRAFGLVDEQAERRAATIESLSRYSEDYLLEIFLAGPCTIDEQGVFHRTDQPCPHAPATGATTTPMDAFCADAQPCLFCYHPEARRRMRETR